jgi:hypothetical protein
VKVILNVNVDCDVHTIHTHAFTGALCVRKKEEEEQDRVEDP